MRSFSKYRILSDAMNDVLHVRRTHAHKTPRAETPATEVPDTEHRVRDYSFRHVVSVAFSIRLLARQRLMTMLIAEDLTD